MVLERQIRQIEMNIKRKMKQIKNGEISIKESKIGIQFNALKDYDQASYEKLIQEYKSLIQKIQK